MTSEEMRAEKQRLQEQLQILEKLEREEREGKLKAFVPVFVYSITPVVDDRWDIILDPTILTFRLTRTLQNVDEAKAAGFDWERANGGYKYLYNTITGKMVCASGAGGLCLLMVMHGGHRKLTEDDHKKLKAIEDFLVQNPYGGDVTGIMV